MKIGKIYLIIALLVITSSSLVLRTLSTKNVVPNNEKNLPNLHPKAAGYWDLTDSPIDINNNWSATQSTYPWCTGAGTINNPYVIENVTIDGLQKSSCITIKNTNDYFIIRNCTFYNTTTNWSGMYQAGIWLDNVDNGKIFNCYFTEFDYTGIDISFCSNLNISYNVMEHYPFAGINVWDSDHLYMNYNNFSYADYAFFTTLMFDSEIKHNRIEHMKRRGCVLDSDIVSTLNNTNLVAYNTFFNVTEWAICVGHGRKNTIFNNKIERSEGIFIRGYYNQILNNTLTQCGVLGRAAVWTDRSENIFIGNHIESNEGASCAFDDEVGNVWNNNYYSDYSGKDIDDDGIGDTTYSISGGSAVDTAPLWWDAPIISIVTPTTDIYENNPSFEITIDEGIEDSMWYTLDNGITNITFSGLTGFINNIEWFGTENGPIDIRFYANDSKGYIGTITVQVTKEVSAPDITFISPSVGSNFGSSPPEFCISINERSIIIGRWYTIDNGIHTFNFTGLTATINLEAWNNASEGTITLTIYVMDDLGQIGSESRTITKSSAVQGISGYKILILIGVVSATTLLIVKKKQKHKF